MKVFAGYVLGVALCATVAALLFAALMHTMPGLFPVLLLGACWWAKPLPRYDLDAELAALLKEAQ